MIKIDKATKQALLDLYKSKKIALEGNILKVIEADDEDIEFSDYLANSIEKDKSSRKRRLDITKQVQNQNKDFEVYQNLFFQKFV